MSEPAIIPAHQFTHESDGKVWLVKCVVKGGKGHGGFQWPREGKIQCPRAKADHERAKTKLDNNEDCRSGGLFGWPWGLAIGTGKEPDYAGDWIVFASDPKDCIDLDGKAKCVGEVEVVYYGDSLGAVMKTHAGKMAYTVQSSRGSASNSGDRGSASNSGDRGSASNSGYMGSASNSGDRGSASNSGSRGSASNSGYRGSASNSGDMGSASNSGYRGSASNSGDRGSASNSGYRGSASNSGYRGSASNSGDMGSASNSGDRGIAAITGEYSTIEVSATSLGAVTSPQWQWIVRPGAVVACRWIDSEKKCHQLLLVADELGYEDGQVVKYQNGVIVKEWN